VTTGTDHSLLDPPQLPFEPLLQRNVVITEQPWVRWLLIAAALLFLLSFLLLPLIAIFTEALRNGVGVYWQALQDPDALAAIRLTLLVRRLRCR